ncbi:DUF262 domain-containing protein [Acinetobacter gyllenbergii]|uniref:DUF262 domain-containing protein n=1 Tax=Acinetobacter gyllenbergii TaxID=134534 RepID=UPI00241E0773|nr:DUF262 domain-containing protein [Acinetobacter gyllenbergii]
MLTNDQQKKILNTIQKAREEIKPDNLRLSIGEVISIYKDNELILNPNFQRVFRWSLIQKSRLIESIILGIPLPPIFVSVDIQSIWTVIDGVQRLSTILQFTNNLEVELADNNNDDIDEDNDEDIDTNVSLEVSGIQETKGFILTGLKKLDDLNGLSWNELGVDIQRLIKRHYLDVVSISTVKYEETKFEMFQRLNTGGSSLSDQEKRNCIIIMKSEDFYNRLKDFVEKSIFKDLLKIKKGKIETDYHLELLLRYLIAKGNIYDMAKYPYTTTLMKEFIDDETILLINNNFNLELELNILDKTLNFLKNEINDNIFKKNEVGAFNLSKYEALLVGVASNLDNIIINKRKFLKIYKEIETQDSFKNGTKRGRKALERFKILNDFSREYFKSV